jgi:hypothetical protein
MASRRKGETLVHSFSIATEHISCICTALAVRLLFLTECLGPRRIHTNMFLDAFAIRAHSMLSAQRSACSFLQLFHEPHVQLSMRIPYRVLNEPLDERRAPDRRDLL